MPSIRSMMEPIRKPGIAMAGMRGMARRAVARLDRMRDLDRRHASAEMVFLDGFVSLPNSAAGGAQPRNSV